MLNSFVLWCNFCACKCACTVVVRSPRGGVGDRHLVTVPQGVVGDRLPWGGERQGGGGYKYLYSNMNRSALLYLHIIGPPIGMFTLEVLFKKKCRPTPNTLQLKKHAL